MSPEQAGLFNTVVNVGSWLVLEEGDSVGVRVAAITNATVLPEITCYANIIFGFQYVVDSIKVEPEDAGPRPFFAIIGTIISSALGFIIAGAVAAGSVGFLIVKGAQGEIDILH